MKRIRLLLLALFPLLLIIPTTLCASGDHEADMRPMTAKEKQLYQQAVAVIFKAVPPAPERYAWSIAPAEEELLRDGMVVDDVHVRDYAKSFRLTLTCARTQAAKDEEARQAANSLAPDPALKAEQDRLGKLRKEAKKRGDLAEVDRIKARSKEIELKIREERERKAMPFKYMSREEWDAQVEAKRKVESVSMELVLNETNFFLEHFKVPDRMETHGKMLVKETSYGKVCLLRVFGSYVPTTHEDRITLKYQPAKSDPVTRPRAVYAMMTVEDNAKDKEFAHALLSALDGAALEKLVK